MFLKISENSPAPEPKACNFIKKDTLAQVFSCDFFEISENTFFTEHIWTTASGADLYRVDEIYINERNDWRETQLKNLDKFYKKRKQS